MDRAGDRPGARRGGDRAGQLRAQPAAAGDDAASAAAGARERMRSEHRGRAPGAGQNEVQNEAKGNNSDHLTDAPRHAIDQAACGEFKTGSSNCSYMGSVTWSDKINITPNIDLNTNKLDQARERKNRPPFLESNNIYYCSRNTCACGSRWVFIRIQHAIFTSPKEERQGLSASHTIKC